MNRIKALVIDRVGNQVKAGCRTIGSDELPAGDLLVRVAYSSLNYKDALACTESGNIVKSYPFVPGIDLAGTVVSCESGRFQAGDEVIVTGYGLGVSHYGGYAEYARMPSEWALKLPRELSFKEAMVYGTAGFTAALSVLELQDSGVGPGNGPVLVTGASGGVGTMAVAMLAKLGYEVTASTGKADMEEELIRLGAARVISREALIPERQRPLDTQRWAGAVDCVGGRTLAAILPSLQYGGAVAASGLTGGTELAATVFPFILRGIRLIGIDSVMVGMDKRIAVWDKLASEFKPARLLAMAEEITLEEVPTRVPLMLGGQSRGRVVVKL